MNETQPHLPPRYQGKSRVVPMTQRHVALAKTRRARLKWAKRASRMRRR